MLSNTTVNSIAAVFFKKADIIVAIIGQKTLHWQLNTVIPSGMYDCNFEAIKWALKKRTKKVEMEYEPLIYITIFCLMLWIRFRKRACYVTFALRLF